MAQAQAVALYRDCGLSDVAVYSRHTFDAARPDDTVFTIVGVKRS